MLFQMTFSVCVCVCFGGRGLNKHPAISKESKAVFREVKKHLLALGTQHKTP